jgi:serine/threonine protein kinase
MCYDSAQHMTAYQIINGLQEQWQILEKLGEGDAGEIFRVEALRSRKKAVLKRPLQGSFAAEHVRQAGQIGVEARILKSLASLTLPPGIPPLSIARLLDESLPGNELSERAFIITEEARGVSLAALARMARFGLPPGALPDVKGHLFYESLAESSKLPDLLILRAASAIWALLDSLHTHPTRWIDTESYGVLWNDLKLAHIFWDPEEARIWVIDWGNAQFLDENGASADRQFTTALDYEQFIEEIGRFLLENSPELHVRLKWPSVYAGEDAEFEMDALRNRLNECLNEELARLADLRGRETYMCSMAHPDESILQDLVVLQQEILRCGELPDAASAIALRTRWAESLLQKGQLHAFWEIARELSASSPDGSTKWRTLAVAAAEISPEADPLTVWQAALQNGVDEKWLAALWDFCHLTQADPDLERWKRLSTALRRMAPEVNSGAPTPWVALQRLVQILDDEFRRLSSASEVPNFQTEALNHFAALLARLKIVIKKWTQVEPSPPGSDLSYHSLTEIFEGIKQSLAALGADLSTRLAPVELSLTQAQAQAAIFQDAWQGRGFQTARQSLRNLLLWDPDRRRVLQADLAIESAPTWLEELSSGPQKGENLVDFAIRVEFHGRDLRARVGSARWLESTLALLSELRRGRRPSDLVEENPDWMIDYPWLRKFKRRLPAAIQPSPLSGLSSEGATTQKEAALGEGCDLLLAEALDNWVAEARGSSARVFQGYLNGHQRALKGAAIKLMRPDKIEYALPLFWEEVQVLSAMQDVSGVVKWYECGFIHLDEGQELPHETSQLTAHQLTGKVIRLDPDQAGIFLGELESRAAAAWLPYLALEKKNSQDNLLSLCDVGFTRGNFLPLEQALPIAVQIAEILQSAHERRVVYRDHKILHYYWSLTSKKVTVIDWNVARLHPEGLPEGEVQLDLVQFGARALHHLFTGRPAPGALPVGPNQPQEIEAAPHSYSTSWTYDDQQRLPIELRQIITAVLEGVYESAERLREDLLAQSPAL